METTRKCVRCGQHRPLVDFSRSSGRSDGLHSYCKPCVSEYARLRKVPNPPLADRTCPHCRGVFEPNTRKQVYCSKNCKQKARWARLHPTDDLVCLSCGTSLAGRRTDVKWCSEACSRKGRPQHRAIVRKSRLKTTYGITEEDYNLMLNAQGGGCAICGTDQVRGFGKRMSIDHCHETGKVRGILCGNCNRGIGYLDHDPDRIMAAAAYLRR